VSETEAESVRPANKTILIVDDHPILRRGLVALIESEPDLAVLGAVATCRAALAAIRETPVDLVTVDLVLADGHGLDLVKAIGVHHPRIPSLVLSMHDEALYGARALNAGARGYVAKEQLDETVLTAIRCVLAGGTYMSAALERRLAERYLGRRMLETDSPLHVLSDRELQVFRFVGEGLSTRRIAETLARSVKTIESHLEHIKSKLGFASAAELLRHAIQWIETGHVGRSADHLRIGEVPSPQSGRGPDGLPSTMPHNRSRPTG
jgi:DNA-binding NarL/FixJ family response regulator